MLHKKKNAISWLIEQIIKGNDIPLYNEGNYFRDILHINDTCNAIKLVCDKGATNNIYNIGPGYSTNIKDLLEKTRDISNSKSNFIFKDTPLLNKKIRPNKEFFMNVDKLKSLNFRAEFSTELIIKSFIL